MKKVLVKNQVGLNNLKLTYWDRVIKGKGTVAEDWPTTEELWENVKEEAREVRAILNKPNKKEKNKLDKT